MAHIFKPIPYRLLGVCMIFLASFFQELHAQDISVSGMVTGSDGLGLPGVSVLVQNTANGVSTDLEGKYTISVASSGTLVFSSIAYKKQVIAVDGRTTINVVLQEDTELLDQAVVVGYGTRKKSHVTGAIAQIQGKEVAALQTTRVDEAMAGKLAGVLIQNTDGEPGAAPKIQVRAASSVSGASQPLIVVDGFPISGDLSTVNPNDIQSLEVLKDAASAAIYGSRGANGVILVTTKKGKSTGSGKPTVSYNGYVSTTSRYTRENINPTAGEFADILESNIADGTFNVSQLDQDILDYRIDAFRNAPDVVAVEDWLFQSGVSTSHDWAIGGSTENVNYRASIGYLNADGAAITQGFERYNARLNLDAQLSKKLKGGLNVNGFIGDRDILGHDSRDLLRAYNIHPIYHTEASIEFVQRLDQQAQALGLSPFDDGFRGGENAPWNSSIYTLEPGMTAQDWHYGRSGNGIGGSGDAGPATKLDNTKRTQKTIFGNAMTYLQYEIIEGLNIRTVLGADMRDRQDDFWKGLEFDSQGRSTQTSLTRSNIMRASVLSETTANYNKLYNEVHDVSAVLGVEFQNFYATGTSLSSTNIPFGPPPNFSLLDPSGISVSETNTTTARRSVFGRINYAYANKYLASVSVRRDADSRFGRNNQAEAFPAFSLGWNVHKEDFYQSDFLTNLRLRFSRGTLGTTSFLGAYSSLSLLSPQPTLFGNAFLTPSDLANPDLTWQTNTETNFGANLGFLENRILLGVDYYTSDVENMLIQKSVSEVLGTTSINVNGGNATSSGVEFELNAVVIDKKDFSLSVGANLSTVNTEITALAGLDELPREQYGQSGRGPIFRNYIGGEIGEMWGIETTGEVEMSYLSNPTEFIGQQSGWSYAVDQQQPGEEGYGEIDRTKTVEEGGDLVKIGQNTPDFYWGFSAQANYKKFDFSMQLQGTHGAEVYNIDPLYYGSQWGRGLQPDFDADGDGLADHNNMPYVRNRDQTDAMIQNASYLALRNLTIGYTLDPTWGKKAGLSGARVYIASSNLLYVMADDYTSFNPEGIETTNSGYVGPTTSGVQVGANPVLRTFTLGASVNF